MYNLDFVNNPYNRFDVDLVARLSEHTDPSSNGDHLDIGQMHLSFYFFRPAYMPVSRHLIRTEPGKTTAQRTRILDPSTELQPLVNLWYRHNCRFTANKHNWQRLKTPLREMRFLFQPLYAV
ncbi:hypothetical protein WA026_001437 [Henosepilachna vigintioctopunctata]|uniref:Uncharacterized protein n=1 Tax=Henosepilachna vigintioctopunctata TaxID=420089 RepID=A0AAW1URU5_9CUCU